ncbi:MAG: TRAP transporter large permease subunit [Planctomycetota bacterium]
MMVEWLAPIMFATLLVAIFSGYPVAFCLAGIALIFAAIGVSVGEFSWAFVSGFSNRVFSIMQNQVLLAVPFFIFMGTMLEKSKLAEDLLQTVGQLFGPVRGGLAFAVIVVGALLAAATGVIGASVVAMGMISLPIMLRYQYREELATGVIAASGTLGQIIPPSVVLVVLADQIGTSPGDLFRGALTPGLLLAVLFGIYVAIITILKPAYAPPLPATEREMSTGKLLGRVCFVLIPPLALILVVLGSIFGGIATPTEAGALGAVGAMLLSLFARRLNWERLVETMRATTLLTSMVLFLLVGSTLFALVFRGFDGDIWIEDLLTQLPGGYIGALIVANLVIFLLGFFIDFFEISFIVVPLLAPVFVEKFGVHPAWFGVMVAMNLQTSFLTPPFGFALFYLKGVCPEGVRTSHIYRGVIPFIVIQVLALIAVIVFPQLVTWLIPGDVPVAPSSR